MSFPRGEKYNHRALLFLLLMGEYNSYALTYSFLTSTGFVCLCVYKTIKYRKIKVHLTYNYNVTVVVNHHSD